MNRILAIVSFVALGIACSKPAASTATPTPGPAGANRFNVTVDGSGYHPSTVNVHAGQPTTLVFTRTSDEGCGQQVVFPSLSITRDLPLNQPVEVQVTPTANAPIAFTCGMAMYRGSVVAQ
jgi:plastocyanin domain-containing protein